LNPGTQTEATDCHRLTQISLRTTIHQTGAVTPVSCASPSDLCLSVASTAFLRVIGLEEGWNPIRLLKVKENATKKGGRHCSVRPPNNQTNQPLSLIG
jgi:hypothetical protein